jgi:hypothetical protein
VITPRNLAMTAGDRDDFRVSASASPADLESPENEQLCHLSPEPADLTGVGPEIQPRYHHEWTQ